VQDWPTLNEIALGMLLKVEFTSFLGGDLSAGLPINLRFDRLASFRFCLIPGQLALQSVRFQVGKANDPQSVIERMFIRWVWTYYLLGGSGHPDFS